MRWQWSQARLTLRLTGAAARRSCLLMSTVGVSIAAGCDGQDGGCSTGIAVSGGRLWAVMRYLGSRCGPPWTLRLPRSNVRPGESWSAMGRNQGQDLWLECSMRPRGLREARSARGQYHKTQPLIEAVEDWLDDLGRLATAPGRWEGGRCRAGGTLTCRLFSRLARDRPLGAQAFRVNSHGGPAWRPVSAVEPYRLGPSAPASRQLPRASSVERRALLQHAVPELPRRGRPSPDPRALSPSPPSALARAPGPSPRSLGEFIFCAAIARVPLLRPRFANALALPLRAFGVLWRSSTRPGGRSACHTA